MGSSVESLGDDASHKKIGNAFWLRHCRSWFSFREPVIFVTHNDGGYFASLETGLSVRSFSSNGFTEPSSEVGQFSTFMI